MSYKMRHNVAALLGMALAMGEGQGMMFTGRDNEVFVMQPKEEKPPRGTKEYFFNKEGLCLERGMRKEDCVFKCFAINEKTALKKFNKFLKK